MTTDTMRAAVGASLERWIVALETVVQLPGRLRPTLGYTVFADAQPFDSADAASAFIRDSNLPLGWVRMRASQTPWCDLFPALAALEEGGEPRPVVVSVPVASGDTQPLYPQLQRQPCTVCGVPHAKHGSYPTCATHPYTPDWNCQHVIGAACVGAECKAGCVRARPTAAPKEEGEPGQGYYIACEQQNVALLEAIGYPHEKDTMVSPEEYAAELKRKADAFDARPIAADTQGDAKDAARVLAEFAKTAPGRLPQRVQDAIAIALSPSLNEGDAK